MTKELCGVKKSKDNYKEVNALLEEYNIAHEYANSSKIRCKNVDIYPTNRRFFVRSTLRWGKYTDAHELLTLIYNRE